MIVLLSIKPEYTEKIFSGEKRYEFRKQKPKRVIERIFIYECHPSKNIVGWFSIKRVLSGSPKEIWDKCKNQSGMEKERYFSYCNGKRVIHAFEIDDSLQFDNPIDPFKSISNFKPPQNFTYLGEPMILKMLENMGAINV